MTSELKYRKFILFTGIFLVLSLSISLLFISRGLSSINNGFNLYGLIALLIGVASTLMMWILSYWFLSLYVFRNHVKLLLSNEYDIEHITLGTQPTISFSKDEMIIGKIYWYATSPDCPDIEVEIQSPLTIFEYKGKITGETSFNSEYKSLKSLSNIHTEHKKRLNYLVSEIKMEYVTKQPPISILVNLKKDIEEHSRMDLNENNDFSDEILINNDLMRAYVCENCTKLITDNNKTSGCSINPEHKLHVVLLDIRSHKEDSRYFTYPLLFGLIVSMVLLLLILNISLISFLIIGFVGLLIIFLSASHLHKITAAKNAEHHFYAKRDFILSQLNHN